MGRATRSLPPLAPLALLALFVGADVARSTALGVGFCLDRVTAVLEHTGFVAVSSFVDQVACTAAGHEWCPLLNETDVWTPEEEGADAVEYYWYSGCCTGTQGRNLVPHPEGRPTCQPGKRPSRCASHHWVTKLEEDLLGPGSGYSKTAAPGTTPEDYNPDDYNCICAPTDPNCIKTSKDATICLACETSAPCGPDVVHLGINFFKLHTIDLQTSELIMMAWLRHSWHDRRLDFDRQCYGMTEILPVQGKSGDLEQSRIWTPDLELFNSETPLWGGTQQRLASVYGCQDGKPSRGGCGFVYWSVPGLLKALCKYKGLVNFPYDMLSCELELAGWGLDGRSQDIRARAADGGFAWADDPNNDALSGLTSGSSYQDYMIRNVSVRRVVTQYDCCPNQPWPSMLYKVEFSRSGGWYESKLVVPMIVLTTLSFATFWMNPQVGERLGFGITAILAMLAHDIVAAGMMPVCEERTFLNYLSLVCQGFAEFALLETSIVLFLYHQQCKSWKRALLPRIVRQSCCAQRLPKVDNKSQIREEMNAKRARQTLRDSKETLAREQLFRQIFAELDNNFTGFLEAEELVLFGSFIAGSEFKSVKDLAFMREFHTGSDLHVGFADFVNFCETKILTLDDTEYLRSTAQAFLQASQQRREAVRESWHAIALSIDSCARVAVPVSFATFLAVLFMQDFESLDKIKFGLLDQVLLMATPVWPMLLIGAVCLGVHLRYALHFRALRRHPPDSSANNLATCELVCEPSSAAGRPEDHDAQPRDELIVEREPRAFKPAALEPENSDLVPRR